MTDLRGWIEQQITRTEAIARLATEGPWKTVPSRTDEPGVLEVHETNEPVFAAAYITDACTSDAVHIAHHNPAAVLRRCTADRKILEHHAPYGGAWQSSACEGCGSRGQLEDPAVEHINDCPTLLALAEGYGLTDEILAGLDRPEPEPPSPRPGGSAGMARAFDPGTPMTDVPPALRGPNWKP